MLSIARFSTVVSGAPHPLMHEGISVKGISLAKTLGSSRLQRRFETLEPRHLLAADVVINEFMAANQQTITDGYGASSDWIELHNRGDVTADLSELFLTDDRDNLNMWQFPEGMQLAAEELLLVYASGFDQPDVNGDLHTNFRLSPNGGYLALANSRFELLSEFGGDRGEYPHQFADISYGIQGGSSPLTATDVPKIISDSAATTVTSTIDLALVGTITDVNVTVDIDHSWNDDLDVTLISPAGTRIDLFSDVGGSSDNFRSTTLDDEAEDPITESSAPFTGRFQPEEALSTFDGESIAGIWTLEISDDFPVEGGILQGWSLELTTPDRPLHAPLIGFLNEPTPGGRNSGDVSNAGPALKNVTEHPGRLDNDSPLVITAEISKQYAPIASVDLIYRVMYTDEVTIAMHDNGVAGDAIAADGIFTATIPAEVASPSEMIRWRVVTQDSVGRQSRAPAFLDSSGTDQSPEYFGTVVKDATVASQLPVLDWFLEPGTEGRTDTTRGTRAAIFYDDEFYDNVFVRIRGGSSVGLPKKSYKLDFNTANDFRFANGVGRTREINLNTTYTNKDYIRQDLGFETYDAAGLPASEAFPVRVQRDGTFFSVAMLIEQPDADLLSREGLDPEGALYKMFNAFTSAKGSVEKKTREYESNDDLSEFVREINRLEGEELRNYVFDNVNVPAVLNYLAVTVLIQNNDQMKKNYFLYRDTNGSGEWMFMPWDLDLTFGLHYMSNDNILDDTIWADKDHDRTFAGVTISPSHPYVGDQEHPANRSWNRLIDTLYEIPEFRDMYLRRLRSLMDDLLQPPDTPVANLKFEASLDAYEELLADDVALDYAKWADPWRWGKDEQFAESLQRIKDEYFTVRRRHLYETHGVDNLEPDEPTVLVPQFTAVRYLVPSDDSLGNDWITASFDDASWGVGETGVGYENTPRNYQDLIRTRVKPTEVAADSTSLFVRIPFTIDDLSKIEELTLRMKYDDGFVAYLNGVEVSRSNLRAEGAQSYNSRARSRSSNAALEFENFSITPHVNQVVQGNNVLAIHLLNSSASNSDLMLLPELLEGVILTSNIVGIPHAQLSDISLEFGSDIEFNPASGNQDEEYLTIRNPNDFAVDVSGWKITGDVNAELSSGAVIRAGTTLYLSPNVKAFRNRATSPSGNAGHFVQSYEGWLPNFGGMIQLLDPNDHQIDSLIFSGEDAHPQQDLRITEINYNPHAAITEFGELDSDNDSFEFVEIKNIGETSIDLTGLRLVESTIDADAQGITFTFTEEQLEAGKHVVVVKSQAAFQSRFGDDVKVAGEFQGKLSNGGETLTMIDGGGDIIQQFQYDDSDDWPELADGNGASLEIVNAAGDYQDPANWQASELIGGSAGRDRAEISNTIVINEILTRTETPTVDRIEIYNRGNEAVDVAGWYLTDSSNLTKFTIPAAGALLDPESYLVFDENQLAFGFKGSEGDDASLIRADATGRPIAFADHVAFDSADLNKSWGRWPNGSGSLQVMQIPTFGLPNSGPTNNGDFDGDSDVDANDIDLLCHALRKHQPIAGGDLDSNGAMDPDDFRFLVKENLATNVGDANLDTLFNSSDLVLIFQAGQYEDSETENSGWATGDWNCDGEFDSSDLVVAFRDGSYAQANAVRGKPQHLGAAILSSPVTLDKDSDCETSCPQAVIVTTTVRQQLISPMLVDTIFADDESPLSKSDRKSEQTPVKTIAQYSDLGQIDDRFGAFRS